MTSDKSALGRRSRRKGQSFELDVKKLIASALHACLSPGGNLVVRRSSQAERAHEADLIIEGPLVPTWLRALWVECEHANAPDPRAKYAQAARDAGRYEAKMQVARTPLVVWKSSGERIVWATTSLASVSLLVGGVSVSSDLLVTARFHDLLADLRCRLTADACSASEDKSGSGPSGRQGTPVPPRPTP